QLLQRGNKEVPPHRRGFHPWPYGSAIMQRLASSSPKLRILVADDYPDTVESLQILFTLWGHEVRVARSGREALAGAQAFRPDVVMLDFQMPGLNGGEVARWLRRWPGFEHLLLIAVTGYESDEEDFGPYLPYFDHVFRKPFSLGQLEEVLGAPAGL